MSRGPVTGTARSIAAPVSPAGSAGRPSPRSARWTRSSTKRSEPEAGSAQILRRRGDSPTPDMYTTTVRSVAAIRFLEEGSHNVKMKQLIGHEDGARKTAMHELIITKGGFSAMHRHEWDHQLVVTEGRGVAILDGKKLALRPGVVLLVQSNEEHQFLQRGGAAVKLVSDTPI